MDTRKALAWFWLIAIDLNMLSGYSYVVSGESFLDLPRLVDLVLCSAFFGVATYMVTWSFYKTYIQAAQPQD